MTKLTDIQLMLLTTASQRADGSLLPPPESLEGQVARIRKAVAALIKRGLAIEVDVPMVAAAWRSEDDRRNGVVITNGGRTAIGVEAPTAAEAPTASLNSSTSQGRSGTKQAMVLDLLHRKDGASIEDLTSVTGWLPHTTRSALTGLRKKGHVIVNERVDGVSHYRIEQMA